MRKNKSDKPIHSGRTFGNRRYYHFPRNEYRSKKVAKLKAEKLRKGGAYIRVVKGKKDKQPIYKLYTSW